MSYELFGVIYTLLDVPCPLWSINCFILTELFKLIRFLVDRDNVEWTDEQEEAAKRKVSENSYPLPAEKQGFILTLEIHTS